MPVFAIGILLLSALLHTTWNLVIKQAKDKYVIMWWMVVVSGVIGLSMLLFTGLPPRQMWIFAPLSAFTEAAYFVILSYAYRDSDFSLVYPVARGAAPAFLAIWSYLFLHERPTSGGAVGLAMIIGGLIIIGASTFLSTRIEKLHFKGIAAALVISLLISIYTVIDGAAVQHGFAIPYVMTMFVLVPLPITPFVLREYGWTRLKEEWAHQSFRIPMIGALGVIAYMLAVIAYSIAPLNYSGTIREVSVVMGAFAGWQFLGEKLGGMRVIGAIIIFAGILMIAMFG